MVPTIPDDWKPQLREYLRRRTGHEREQLSAADFSARQSVMIKFPDGSQVFFRFAFAVTDDAQRAVAVFTEHCGYHVFPIGGAELEVLESVPLDHSPGG